MLVRIEQHLVRLERIGPYDERPAVRQLGMSCLQLQPFAAQNGPVLAPVELEGFAGLEHQRHERAPARRLLLDLTVRSPRRMKAATRLYEPS